MTRLLGGKEVAEALCERLKKEAADLKKSHIFTTIGIIRVGNKPEDIAYEKSIVKCAEDVGVNIKKYILSEDIEETQLIDEIREINKDDGIHGVILFRPLPSHIDDSEVRKAIMPSKDLDGITDMSMTGVYGGTGTGFPPCTPKACMEILKHYGIEIEGKKVAVLGRSLVVGKPLAMMVLEENGTPAICHSKTKDIKNIAKEADILMAALGRAKMVDKEYFREGQVVIDVGINTDESGELCGDVNFEQAEGIVEAITPVPGGVGRVTTSILISHAVEAAKRTLGSR